MSMTNYSSSSYEVICVGTSEKATEFLKLAFETMDKRNLDPVWKPHEECLKISMKGPTMYVMDPFEGETFEHLKSIKCRIVGPLCILYCLQRDEALPKRPYPIYSVCMRKMTVTCSNLDNALRDSIQKKVELMGGLFSKDLTKSVSHLVVGEVGSKKYQVGGSFGLPIMTPEWIEELWGNGQQQLLHASDSSFDKYKCPIFKGLVVTVSQMTVEERSAVQSIVEKNGGMYLSALKAYKTTHLVLIEPMGDKYRYAKNWNIYRVNINWIHESVKAGYCKDEILYKVDESSKAVQPKRSTPNRDLTCDLPPVDCSAITNASVITHLDETIRSEVSFRAVCKRTSWASLLEAFDLSSLPKNGQFLDGCKIFLSGFNSSHLDKLKKIVNAGGGVRFNKYGESVTHVVCGDLSSELLQCLESSSVKPYVVNLNWLLDCCRNESLIDEKPFLCMDAFPLSPDKNAPEEGRQASMSQLSKSQSKADDVTKDDIADILKQYMGDQNKHNESVPRRTSDGRNSVGANESGSTSLNLESERLQSDRGSTSKNETANVDVQDLQVVDLEEEDEETSSSENLFAGLKFAMSGFNEGDTSYLAGLMKHHGGTVFRNAASGQADIVVVPVLWNERHTHGATNVVTNCWLLKCIEDTRIYVFDENELFKPITLQDGEKPFDGLVLSVSQYTGVERECLTLIIEVLGGTCQEYFVRKANASRGILSNTHLIVANPEGSKYEAAKKWKIPAVTKHWVLDSARLGEVPPVEKYLVDASPAINDAIDQRVVLAEMEPGKENINKNSLKAPIRKSNGLLNNSKKHADSNQDTPKSASNKFLHPADVHLMDQPQQSTPKPLSSAFPKDDWNREPHSSGAKMPELTPVRRMAGLHKTDIRSERGMTPSRDDTEFSILDLDQPYAGKFDVSSILRKLDASGKDMSTVSNGSVSYASIAEMLGKNLDVAVARLGDVSDIPSPAEKQRFVEAMSETRKKANILTDVVVYVSKKLASVQNEQHETVASLGGNYVWSCDSSCTHFVFTGKVNDTNREFRDARAVGKKIVCPEWVHACRDKNTRLEEDLYPHTFKLNLSLADDLSILKNPVSGTRQDPPQRSEDEPKKENFVDFDQQLNELLVAAKSAKQKRQSRRLQQSVSSSPVNDASPILKQVVPSAFLKSSDTCPEEQDTQSQGFQIVWDDPTGRQEREKIAALAAAKKRNSTPKPSPKKESTSVKPSEDDLLPPLKLDFADPVVNPRRKFMFTSIAEAIRLQFVKIITELGGEVSEEKAFDASATHLLVEKPIKNEKFLCSVASGKWVLHPSYLSASQDNGSFLCEEDFEWGGPSTGEFSQSRNRTSIALCPSRWRSRLNADSSEKGAFQGWVVVLITEDTNKQATYSRILESGSAEIVPAEAADAALERITHVVVDMKKRSLSQVDLSAYVRRNAKCIKPEYFAFYLINDPPPDVDSFVIPEAKQLNVSETSTKRRNLSVSNRGSKRSRFS